MESSSLWEQPQSIPLIQWSSSSSSSFEDLNVGEKSSEVVPHMMMSPVYHTMTLEEDDVGHGGNLDDDLSQNQRGISTSNSRSVSPMRNLDRRSAIPQTPHPYASQKENDTIRRRRMGEPEDLELMTVTVLDGDLDSNIEQAFVKVSENVHILKQSSLQASRVTKDILPPLNPDVGSIIDVSTNFNSRMTTALPKRHHDMTKSFAHSVPNFDLSPKSVMSLDIPMHNYAMDNYHHHQSRSTNSVKSTSSSTATPASTHLPPTKLHFYDGRPAHSSIEFRPSHPRNTVNFQLASHKRVHSTGNHHVFRSMDSKSVSALRPSRYLASPSTFHSNATSTPSSTHTNTAYGTAVSSSHPEIRHSKSWSPLTAAAASMIPTSSASDNSVSKHTTLSNPVPSSVYNVLSSSSTSSSLSISQQLYPNPHPSHHSLPKSILTKKTTSITSSNMKMNLHSNTNNSSSTSSKISLPSTLSSHSSHDRPIPSSSSSSKAMSLETIHDTSPYNSPKPKSKKQYRSSSKSKSSSIRKKRMTPLEQTLTQLKSSDSNASSRHNTHKQHSSKSKKQTGLSLASSSSLSKESKDTASFVKINMKREEGVEIHCQCSLM